MLFDLMSFFYFRRCFSAFLFYCNIVCGLKLLQPFFFCLFLFSLVLCCITLPRFMLLSFYYLTDFSTLVLYFCRRSYIRTGRWAGWIHRKQTKEKAEKKVSVSVRRSGRIVVWWAEESHYLYALPHMLQSLLCLFLKCSWLLVYLSAVSSNPRAYAALPFLRHASACLFFQILGPAMLAGNVYLQQC